MTPREAIDALTPSATLGPDAVADLLRAAGVRGYRWEAEGCPVANWLRGRCPGYSFLVVGGEVSWREAESTRWDRETVPSLEGFVVAFDARWYPDLIAA